MKEFDEFQKQVIKVLAKIKAPANIDLTSILVQFIPNDMFIGVEEPNDIIQKIGFIRYKEGQIEYVHGILSTKISSFINLIDELVKNDFLIKEPIISPFVQLSIGNAPTDDKNYARYSLGSNLSYEKMREVFILSKYYTTEKLNKLPKYDFLELTDFIAFRNLKYTRYFVMATFIAILMNVVFEILSLVCR